MTSNNRNNSEDSDTTPVPNTVESRSSMVRNAMIWPLTVTITEQIMDNVKDKVSHQCSELEPIYS